MAQRVAPHRAERYIDFLTKTLDKNMSIFKFNSTTLDPYFINAAPTSEALDIYANIQGLKPVVSEKNQMMYCHFCSPSLLLPENVSRFGNACNRINYNEWFEEYCLSRMWKTSPQILKFDPSLSKALIEMEDPDNVPLSILEQIPYECFYIDCPNVFPSFVRDGKEVKTNGCFVGWSISITSTGEYVSILQMRFLGVDNEFSSMRYGLPLIGNTLGDAFSYLKNEWIELESSFPQGDLEVYGRTPEFVAPVFNHLLYLCSNVPDINKDYTPARALRLNPKKPWSNAEIHSVGTRIGSELRMFEKQDEASRHSMGTGRTQAPHIRRAHWHPYWCGSERDGTRHLELRWVTPVYVNARKGRVEPVVRSVTESGSNMDGLLGNVADFQKDGSNRQKVERNHVEHGGR